VCRSVVDAPSASCRRQQIRERNRHLIPSAGRAHHISVVPAAALQRAHDGVGELSPVARCDEFVLTRAGQLWDCADCGRDEWDPACV